MRPGWALVVIAMGATLVVGGCIGDQTPSQASGGDEGDGVGPAGNGSLPQEGSASGGSEGTETDTDEGTPALGDLTMENAERSRPNASTVVFIWTGELAFDQRAAEAAFDLPRGLAFEVSGELSWEGDARLVQELASPTTNYLCSTGSRAQDRGVDSPVGCGVVSLAREDPGRWTARVQRENLEVELPQPFTVEVEIRALDPGSLAAQPSLREDPGNATVEPGWPEPPEADVRPGVKIHNGACTAGFVFAPPDNGSLYIATASHCFESSTVRLGDDVTIGSFAVTGTLVYCSWGAREGLLSCPSKTFGEDDGFRDDLALVEIPETARSEVHPAVLVRGGPTGLGQPPTQGDEVFAYGNSGLRDGYQGVNALDSRPGIVQEGREETTVAHFAPPAMAGDSGGPVLAADGSAIGLFSFIEDGVPGLVGSSGIANLAYAMERFEERTGRSMELATWPLFETPEPALVE